MCFNRRVGGSVIMLCNGFGRILGIVVAGVLGAGIAFPQDRSAQRDKDGIERLHQQDKDATLSDRADELAKLWDTDAVRIQPGRPAEISKAVIYANDKRWEASTGRERTLCYDMEVQDLQIAGDWAFEWGYFSYKVSKDGKQTTGQGKVMRVMKRQTDGSWKFARVMGLPENDESAAPVAHRCR
jgi:ketosteroid isomerase-like protein